MTTEISSCRPANYGVCLRNDCPLANNCLRQLHAQDPCADERFINVVNPSLVKNVTSKCDFYRPNTLVRVAYGIRHIFDTVPHSKYNSVFHSVIGLFGKSTYYRIYHKQRPIWPKEQEQIRRIFAFYGSNEPVEFEEYRDIIDW